jgi:hypothetical protein
LRNRDQRTGNAAQDVASAYNDAWWDWGTNVVGTRRTSLVIDPKDGRIPPLKPELEKREGGRGFGGGGPLPAGPEAFPLSERCIVGFNSGPPMNPSSYNNNVHLFQTAGTVALLNEMVHNARIVPLDGRPHLPDTLRQWIGDSRGRWEGDTLVVETRNFDPKMVSVPGAAFRGSLEHLHLVERFSRPNFDTLIYQYTFNNPATYTRPWTVEIAMSRSEEPVYEYACHEGNYAMVNMLAGARAQEKTPAAERTPGAIGRSPQ